MSNAISLRLIRVALRRDCLRLAEVRRKGITCKQADVLEVIACHFDLQGQKWVEEEEEIGYENHTLWLEDVLSIHPPHPTPNTQD